MTSTMHKPEISIADGVAILDRLNTQMPGVFKIIKNKKTREQLFDKIYPASLVKHMKSNYSDGNINRLILNSDYTNQQLLFNYVINPPFDFTYPPVEALQEKGIKQGFKQWEYLEARDIRTMWSFIKGVTIWEVYPHALVLINKFILYANNHSLDYNGEADTIFRQALQAYKGDRFGNYENWCAFWNTAPLFVKHVIVARLVDNN